MQQQMEYNIWIVAFLGFVLESCDSSAVIEMRLVRYDINNGRLASGTKPCCDAGSIKTCPSNDCDPYFYICVQDVRHLSGCQMGELKTGFTENNDHLQFSDNIGITGTPNPIIFHVPEYTGVIIPKITMFDEDIHAGAAQDDKIDYAQHVYTHPPDYNNNRTHVYKIDMQGQESILNVEINVRCDARYYGNDCKKYCEPDDQSFCDSNGNLVCIPGKACDPNRTPRTPKPTTLPTSTSTTSTTAVTTPSKPPPSPSSPSSLSTPPSLSSSTTTATTTATLSPTKSSTTMPTTVSTTGSSSVKATSGVGQSTVTTTTFSSTTTSEAGILCNLSNHTGRASGVYQLSTPNATDLDELQTHLASAIASVLSLNISDILVNLSVISQTARESVYNAMFYQTGTQQPIDSGVSGSVVKRLCKSTPTLQRRKQAVTEDDGGSNTVLIVGLVSAVLVTGILASLLFFVYKRKCKRTQVADEKAEAITNTS